MYTPILFSQGSKIQIVPSLGPKVYQYDLLWAIWSPRDFFQEILITVTKPISLIEWVADAFLCMAALSWRLFTARSPEGSSRVAMNEESST